MIHSFAKPPSLLTKEESERMKPAPHDTLAILEMKKRITNNRNPEMTSVFMSTLDKLEAARDSDIIENERIENERINQAKTASEPPKKRKTLKAAYDKVIPLMRELITLIDQNDPKDDLKIVDLKKQVDDLQKPIIEYIKKKATQRQEEINAVKVIDAEPLTELELQKQRFMYKDKDHKGFIPVLMDEIAKINNKISNKSKEILTQTALIEQSTKHKPIVERFYDSVKLNQLTNENDELERLKKKLEDEIAQILNPKGGRTRRKRKYKTKHKRHRKNRKSRYTTR